VIAAEQGAPSAPPREIAAVVATAHPRPMHLPHHNDESRAHVV